MPSPCYLAHNGPPIATTIRLRAIIVDAAKRQGMTDAPLSGDMPCLPVRIGMGFGVGAINPTGIVGADYRPGCALPYGRTNGPCSKSNSV